VEEIYDAVTAKNFDQIIREIHRAKEIIRELSREAPPDIREEYLPKILESYDTFEFNVRVDLEKYPKDVAWEEIEEHFAEFRDRNLHYLIMAVMDLERKHELSQLR